MRDAALGLQVESAVPDCTINTRLACEDIMSMFSDDLPCESTASRRRGAYAFTSCWMLPPRDALGT